MLGLTQNFLGMFLQTKESDSIEKKKLDIFRSVWESNPGPSECEAETLLLRHDGSYFLLHGKIDEKGKSYTHASNHRAA